VYQERLLYEEWQEIGGEETQVTEFPVRQIFSACLLAGPFIIQGRQAILQFREFSFFGGGVTG